MQSTYSTVINLLVIPFHPNRCVLVAYIAFQPLNVAFIIADSAPVSLFNRLSACGPLWDTLFG